MKMLAKNLIDYSFIRANIYTGSFLSPCSHLLLLIIGMKRLNFCVIHQVLASFYSSDEVLQMT